MLHVTPRRTSKSCPILKSHARPGAVKGQRNDDAERDHEGTKRLHAVEVTSKGD
jgi:hypothetical protein